MKSGKYQDGMNERMLERAVVEVYLGIESAGMKPASEHWTLYAHPHAKEMVRRVRAAYKRLAGFRFCGEPWLIAQKYMDFRKMGTVQKAAFRADLEHPTLLAEIA